MALRRLPPSVWARLRSGRGAGLAAGAATLACIRTGLAFSGAAEIHFTPGVLVAGASASVLTGLLAAYLRGKSRLLPDSFVDETGVECPYQVEFCTPAVLRVACDLTRDSYADEYVSHDIAEQWRLRNPRAFVQIMNPENRLCACFGVLALRQSFMDQFIAGRVSDLQLGGEDVCTWSESQDSSRLYLSGVVVLEPTTFQGSKRARVMIWAMLEYMRRLYGIKTPRQLYAVAVTKESSRLMTNLGFVVHTSAALRSDKYDLFRYDLTEASWNALLRRVGDLSPMCCVDFTAPENGQGRSTARSEPPGSTQSHSRLTVLFVAGDRGGSQRNQVQIPREFASIQEALRASENRHAFSLATPILAASRQTLVEAYRHEPVILHFAGHGDDRSLSLIVDQGVLVSQTDLMAEQLATILGSFPQRVRLCVLNTCDSAPIAEHLAQTNIVEAAVGWPARLADDVAIAFSRALYGGLGNGVGLSHAITLAAQACGASDTPVLYTAEGVVRDVVYSFPKD